MEFLFNYYLLLILVFIIAYKVLYIPFDLILLYIFRN